jgi:hypothetical protein
MLAQLGKDRLTSNCSATSAWLAWPVSTARMTRARKSIE